MHGYYRAVIPGMKLREHGLALSILDDEGSPEDRIMEADIVVIGRPNKQEELDFIKELRKTGTLVVLDTDDLPHLVYTLNPELEALWTDERLNVFEECVREVDLVMVSVPPMADSMEELLARRVAVTDNALDPRSRRWDIPWPEDDGRVRIGWSAGWTHAQDLEVIERPIKQILAKYPQAVFVSVGYLPTWVADLDPDQLEIRPSADVVDYPQKLVGIDIGLGPLSKVPFNNYRSVVKCWELTCAGSCFVASDYGPYARDLVNGETALLCDTEGDWVGALSTLIESPETRQRLWRQALRTMIKRSIDWQVLNWYWPFRVALSDRIASRPKIFLP